MGQPQVENKKYTIEEWLALEAEDGIRYEYHYGDVYAMAGGTLNHGTLGDNTFFELETHFRKNGGRCRAMSSEFKIEIAKAGRYVYPDTVAVCRSIEESDQVKGAIINPVLVVEVTSKSSEAYDRAIKYDYYISLPSVKQYMIVSQLHPLVTLYNRNPATNVFDLPPVEVRGLAADIDLFSVGFQMPMQALYRNVEFQDRGSFLYRVK